jgi:hypothetical protein
MKVCTLATQTALVYLAMAGLLLDLVGTLVLVSPLFALRPRDVVRGDAAPAWSQEGDKEAKLLRRQRRVLIPGAVLLTAGVLLQVFATFCSAR